MQGAAPQFVKAFVKSNKNDAADAEAICEAVQRPSMRFVAIKSVEQQDIQAIHRLRSLVVGQLTALINQTRGLLLEFGLEGARHCSGTCLRSLRAPRTASVSAFAPSFAGSTRSYNISMSAYPTTMRRSNKSPRTTRKRRR